MGKKSPDVKGAAREEGRSAERLAREKTYADRPDQFNPWGSVTWETDQVGGGGSGGYGGGLFGQSKGGGGDEYTRWTQRQTLSDPAQRIFDAQTGVAGGRQELAQGMMGRIGQEMGSPLDWDQFGEAQGLEFDPTELRQRSEDAAYGRSTSRLDPQYEQREQAMEIKLRNQGLRPGDQAYDSSMASFGRDRSDAYEQARLQSTATGMSESQQAYQQQMGSTEMANALRQQQIQEYLGKRGQSLSEQEALMQGQGLADVQGATTG